MSPVLRVGAGCIELHGECAGRTTMAGCTIQAAMGAAGRLQEQLPSEALGRWWVLHTRSRQEKALARDLGAMGIGRYLPLVRTIRYYGRHKAMKELPLFPGYVFMRGRVEETYLADRTHRVVSIIRVADQERLQRELESIHLACSRNAPLERYPFLREGVWVEVRSGPFRGLRGLIEETTGNGRLILRVSILNSAVSLELDGALVDRLE